METGGGGGGGSGTFLFWGLARVKYFRISSFFFCLARVKYFQISSFFGLARDKYFRISSFLSSGLGEGGGWEKPQKLPNFLNMGVF